MSEEYDLDKSAKGLGKLYPILRDKQGNIIDGFHRQNVDPDWPSVTIDSVDSEQKLELARLASNFCRRTIKTYEFENKLRFLVGKCGMKPGEISEQTGIGLTTIYKYLPQELKDQKKVEAGKVSGEVRSVPHVEQTVKTYDTSELVECERCHTHVSKPNIKVWHGHNLCDKCHERAELNPEGYDGYFKYLERVKDKKVPESLKPRPFPQEAWKDREARMHPQKSSFELAVIQELQVEGLPIETDREFCLQKTVPDGFIPSRNIAVYIDNEATHKNTESDEVLRERLTKLHDIHVLPIRYKADTKEERERAKAEIREFLKWEGS